MINRLNSNNYLAKKIQNHENTAKKASVGYL